MTKKCSKCETEKPLNEFYKDKRSKDGFYSMCKLCKKIRKKKWETDNREKHLESHRKRSKRYCENNPEKRKKSNKKWKQNNKDKLSAYKQNRRAKKKNAIGKINSELIKTLLEEQNYKCAYCSCDIKENYTIDHIIALHLGGNNLYENLAMCCPHCNYSKGAKTLTEWAKHNGWIGEKISV